MSKEVEWTVVGRVHSKRLIQEQHGEPAGHERYRGWQVDSGSWNEWVAYLNISGFQPATGHLRQHLHEDRVCFSIPSQNFKTLDGEEAKCDAGEQDEGQEPGWLPSFRLQKDLWCDKRPSVISKGWERKAVRHADKATKVHLQSWRVWPFLQ